eukprot:5562905-Heterocapsa_arctica.AAC.1
MEHKFSGHFEGRTCNGHMRPCTNKRGQDSWINNLHGDEDKQGTGQDLQWYGVDWLGCVVFLQLSGQGSLDAEVLAQTH